MENHEQHFGSLSNTVGGMAGILCVEGWGITFGTKYLKGQIKTGMASNKPL